MNDETHGAEERTEAQEHYLRMGDAARKLGVSRMKMWKLVKSGAIAYRKDLLDQRVTLIPVSEVDRLLRQDLRAQRVAVA